MTKIGTIDLQLPLFDLPERAAEDRHHPPLSARVSSTITTWQADIASGWSVNPVTVTQMIGDLTALLLDEMDERARAATPEGK